MFFFFQFSLFSLGKMMVWMICGTTTARDPFEAFRGAPTSLPLIYISFVCSFGAPQRMTSDTFLFYLFILLIFLGEKKKRGEVLFDVRFHLVFVPVPSLVLRKTCKLTSCRRRRRHPVALETQPRGGPSHPRGGNCSTPPWPPRRPKCHGQMPRRDYLF